MIRYFQKQLILLGIAIFFLSTISAQEVCNLLKEGANNTGTEINTTLINNTINRLTQAGGGTVYFPSGTYLTGPIELKSNITIHLEAGATLKFTDDFDAYLPMIESRWEGIDVINFKPLIYANKATNISIIGRGTIDGQGRKWWDFHHILYSKPNDYKSKWQKIFAENNKDVVMPDIPGMIERGFCRPPLFQPMYCSNILIDGITITNSPFWTVNPEFCENINLINLTVYNPDSPNTDGINPESCKNVHIANCNISVGDDCITIKSGKDRAGRLKNVPCENITITNCTMQDGHGGVVIGSEMSGGIKKVTISNCVFEGTDRGIRIKSTRGRGGVVEDINVSNVVMKNIRKEAIKINMFYSKTEEEPVSERTPAFRNIHINNLTGSAYQAGFLLGLNELKLADISFSNIHLESQVGFTIEDAEYIAFNNCVVNTKSGHTISTKNSRYLEINNVKNNLLKQDFPLFQLTDSQDTWIYNCYPFHKTEIFLNVEGSLSKRITISDNNFQNVNKVVDLGDNVNKKEVSIED